MSITDELRKWASVEVPYKYGHQLTAIADRIDIAHKHAIGYVDDRDPETMAENGWVKLPVDADGVPIRIGDVMEGEKVGGGFCEPFEVVGYIMSNGELEPMDEHKLPRKRRYLHHHHEPTVEDVLAEFFEQVGDGLHTLEAMDTQLIIAKYAAKLRLADDGEGQ